MIWSMSGPHPSGITIWTLKDPDPFSEVTIHSFGSGFTMSLDYHQAPHFITFEDARSVVEATLFAIRNTPPKKRKSRANSINI